jgi:hypothetical protein
MGRGTLDMGHRVLSLVVVAAVAGASVLLVPAAASPLFDYVHTYDPHYTYVVCPHLP